MLMLPPVATAVATGSGKQAAARHALVAYIEGMRRFL